MNIRVSAKGKDFGDGADIDGAVDLLEGFGVAFSWCLNRTAANLRARYVPRLRLTTVGPGSIDIRLITEIAAAVAPLAPEIFGTAWKLYKAGFDLVQIANRRLKTEGKPVTITITDSPGAAVTVNIVGGNQVQTGYDVFDFASKNHGFFKRLASLVLRGRADEVLAEAPQQHPQEAVAINRGNCDDFDVKTIETIDDAPITLECNFYRFNKRSLRGYLEYEDDDGQPQRMPFTIAPHLHDDSIKAFADDAVMVRALRKMEMNALGESKISGFHLVGIDFKA